MSLRRSLPTIYALVSSPIFTERGFNVLTTLWFSSNRNFVFSGPDKAVHITVDRGSVVRIGLTTADPTRDENFLQVLNCVTHRTADGSDVSSLPDAWRSDTSAGDRTICD
ncbi:hypothetical protein DPMN_000608 [Dreissena polymorpha]|uniref:Uncharacterized protein n=1 Tax=Dreissena polymorpha TaxID=45954 RepID=A0A9D4MHP8_DREPO|nr:hypothetical protein DPMN_000608 [Dreissena polymorpha]